MSGCVSDEELIEAVVRVLLSDEQDPRRLVRLLVGTWPEAASLQIISVLAMAAGSVEHMLAGAAATRNAQDCWRMAGLIGVDLCMMQRMGLPHDTAGDLMAYWLVYDRFFLG